jgi:hypothetical protein
MKLLYITFSLLLFFPQLCFAESNEYGESRPAANAWDQQLTDRQKAPTKAEAYKKALKNVNAEKFEFYRNFNVVSLFHEKCFKSGDGSYSCGISLYLKP